MATVDQLYFIFRRPTSLDVGFRKPSPLGLLRIAEHFKVPPAQLVYVGNQPKDAVSALRACALPVLVDRAGTAPPRAGVRTIGSLAELGVQLLATSRDTRAIRFGQAQAAEELHGRAYDADLRSLVRSRAGCRR